MNLPTFPVIVHLLSLYGEQGSNRVEVAFKHSFSALPGQVASVFISILMKAFEFTARVTFQSSVSSFMFFLNTARKTFTASSFGPCNPGGNSFLICLHSEN